MTPGPKYGAFTGWAKEQGIVINGVASAEIPGKGVGIIAARKLKKGESVISVPASAMVTHDTHFVRTAGIARGTVYGTIAAAFTINHENEERWWKLWQNVWPSREEFKTNIPICWTRVEQDLLPPAARALLKHQQEKYELDFETVKAKIPEHLLDWYLYYWLIVDTRCFYWIYFKRFRDEAKKGRKLARDECLALVPWGDYFNHAEQGVSREAR
jgi:hypothetical protein